MSQVPCHIQIADTRLRHSISVLGQRSRALFHHQTYWPGYWPGSVHGVWLSSSRAMVVWIRQHARLGYQTVSIFSGACQERSPPNCCPKPLPCPGQGNPFCWWKNDDSVRPDQSGGAKRAWLRRHRARDAEEGPSRCFHSLGEGRSVTDRRGFAPAMNGDELARFIPAEKHPGCRALSDRLCQGCDGPRDFWGEHAAPDQAFSLRRTRRASRRYAGVGRGRRQEPPKRGLLLRKVRGGTPGPTPTRLSRLLSVSVNCRPPRNGSR